MKITFYRNGKESTSFTRVLSFEYNIATQTLTLEFEHSTRRINMTDYSGFSN